MFRLPPNTSIEVYAPFGKIGSSVVRNAGNDVDERPWKRTLTKKETMLDKHQVWDRAALENKRRDIPEWAALHIKIGYTVFREINGDGAQVLGRVRGALEYLD